MYRYRYDFLKDEAIYIAGPECFYTGGYDMLAAMRVRAESIGFGVTLPNNHPLDLDNPDKNKRADSIFADLEKIMLDTTVIIADLEAYRGSEPDAGTVYELGMAYAKGARCYGYSRDKRSLATKNQRSYLKNGKVYDERGWEMPYAELPFCPTIIGSTKVIEGDFDDCLHMLITDIEEEQKQPKKAQPVQEIRKENEKPVIYLATFERYDADAVEKLNEMKRICRELGYDAISPLDEVDQEEYNTANVYGRAGLLFDQYQKHVRACDIVVANLNDFRGYEVNNDVAFECGMGFQLGKKLFGYMDNTDKLINRIPHLGEEKEFRDQTGSNVEDFDYPANLMFASSMPIYEGDFAAIMKKVVEELKK